MGTWTRLAEPVNVPVPVRLELCQQLADAFYLAKWANNTKLTAFRVLRCIVHDDGLAYCVSSRTQFVRVMKTEFPVLWANIRPFLRDDSFLCATCGHTDYYHPAGGRDQVQRVTLGHSCCVDVIRNEAIQPCGCTDFVLKLL